MDHTGGTNWSIRASDKEPETHMDIKDGCESFVTHKQDDVREGTAAFVRLHPLSPQTHPHHISTSASSANKPELKHILKPTCDVLNKRV